MLKPTLLLRPLPVRSRLLPMKKFLKAAALRFGGFLFDMGVKLMVIGGGWETIAANRATLPDIEPVFHQPHWWN
jgi:hypothetical protein